MPNEKDETRADPHTASPDAAPIAPEQSERDDSELHRIMYGGEYAEYREDIDLSELDTAAETNTELSTFTQTETPPAAAGKTLTKSQTTLIVVLSAVFVVLIVLYLVLGPVGFDVFGFRASIDNAVVYTTGEVASSGNRWLIFEHTERSNVQSIAVHNDHGDYLVYYNAITETFMFSGAENTSYNQELFSSLIVSSGYTLFNERLEPGERSPDLHEYGLAPEDDPAYFILTTRSGSTHKLYIGNPTLDEDEYYAMYEGRDIVYVLESSLKDTLLADVKSLLVPLLTYPIDTTASSDYYTAISRMYITLERDAPYMLIEYSASPEIQAEFGVTVPYMITYPDELPASTTQITALFPYIINMTADELLEYDICYTTYSVNEQTGEREEIDEIKPEILLKYNITNPEHMLIYYYQEDGISIVYFSAKQTDADGASFYYAWSPMQNIFTKISAEKVPFFEWSKMDYIERAVFNAHIDKVKSIELTQAAENGVHINFVLAGTGDTLTVSDTVSGKRLIANANKNDTKLDDVYNFRQFYKTSLSISTGDFVEEPEEKALLATVTVTMRTDYEMKYEFYAYSNRRCFYTINGEGEFYVSRTMVSKLFSDAQKVLDGVAVDSEADY